MSLRVAGVSQRKVLAFELLVIVPTVLGEIALVVREPGAFDLAWQLALWALGIALVELLPVPAWRGLSISVGFPLLMVVAFLFAPAAAGATAFVGASDPREFRREVTVLRALFNRCQVALSVVAASAVFHAMAGHPF